MKKTVGALIAMIALMPMSAKADSEFPIFTPAMSCTVFGKIPNQACLDKQSETYALAQELWREASEDARLTCRDDANQETGNTSYEILTKCLSFHNGQQRLFIWTIGPSWTSGEN